MKKSHESYGCWAQMQLNNHCCRLCLRHSIIAFKSRCEMKKKRYLLTHAKLREVWEK